MDFRISSHIITLITIFIEFTTVSSLFYSDSVSVCSINGTIYDCRNKNLTAIPMKFPDFPTSAAITHLDFSFNNIKVVQLINLPYPSSILEISFSHNIIDTIESDVFENMTNLQNLDLSYNKISGSSLHTFTSKLYPGYYRKLNLRGNDLGTLEDDTFSSYESSALEYLDLSHCSLKTLEYMSIHNLGSLTYLNLSYNLLTEFEDALPGEMELEILDLSFNKMTTINKIPALMSLKYMYLDYNGIITIKDNVFSSLVSLEFLSVVGNNLKTLRPHTLPLDSIFLDIKEIKLDKNPWRCDCHMKWLLMDTDDASMFTNFTLKCTYPSRLRGKNIFDVSEKELTCTAEYSRLTYILILVFISCFMVAGIGYLIYFKRKCLPCNQQKGGNYIAVYTNDDADEGTNVKITTADDESLVRNEERTMAENGRVQYFDV